MRFPQCLSCDSYNLTDQSGYCQDCSYLYEVYLIEEEYEAYCDHLEMKIAGMEMDYGKY